MALDPLLVSQLGAQCRPIRLLSGALPLYAPIINLPQRTGYLHMLCRDCLWSDICPPPLIPAPPFRVRVGMVDRCVQWWFLGDVSGEGKRDEVLGWQWHQLDHMQTVGTLLQTDNSASTRHSIFTDQMLFLISWCPTNSVKALKTVIWAE